jgi:hypothetical protein
MFWIFEKYIFLIWILNLDSSVRNTFRVTLGGRYSVKSNCRTFAK